MLGVSSDCPPLRRTSGPGHTHGDLWTVCGLSPSVPLSGPEDSGWVLSPQECDWPSLDASEFLNRRGLR